MRSTATWRSVGRATSERKSGWCQAMSARQSTCTTRSGTAAAAEWKEAGTWPRAGKCVRTDGYLESYAFVPGGFLTYRVRVMQTVGGDGLLGSGERVFTR